MWRWIKHYTQAQPNKFRNKLNEDTEADVVELAGVDSPFPRTYGQTLQTIRRTAPASTITAHGDNPLSAKPLTAEQTTTIRSLASYPAATVDPATDALQHWQAADPSVRLVIAALAEQLATNQHVQRLLLTCNSWASLCQHCKEFLSVLLQHYFPDAAGTESLAATSSTADNGPPSSDTNDSVTAILQATIAAGVQLAPSCSIQSVKAAEPAAVLDLSVAVIQAGEAQQLLRDECCHVLGLLFQQQQQLLMVLSHHQRLNAESQQAAGQGQLQQPGVSPGQVFCSCTNSTESPTQQLQHWQQQPMHAARLGQTWLLLQAWLVAFARLGAHQQTASHEADQTQAAGLATEVVSSTAAATSQPSLPWQSVVRLLLQLQHQQQPQQQLSQDSAPSSDLTKQPLADQIDIGIAGQLLQLGCSIPLFQPSDLSQPIVLGTIAPQPLQFVMLLRLVLHTKHLWQPALQTQLYGSSVSNAVAIAVTSDNVSSVDRHVDTQDNINKVPSVPSLTLSVSQAASELLGSHKRQQMQSDEELQQPQTPRQDQHEQHDHQQDEGEHLQLQQDREQSQFSEEHHMQEQQIAKQQQQQQQAQLQEQWQQQVSLQETSAGDMQASSVASMPEHVASNDDDAANKEQTLAADAASSATVSPRTSWPAQLLTNAQLWQGEENDVDAAAITREERTLRCWINSLLHGGRGGASSRAPGRTSSSGSGRIRTSSTGGGLLGSSIEIEVEDFSGLHVASRSCAISTAATTAAATQATSSSDVVHGFSFSSINSLFGAEVRSGVLLLELLDHLQPDCVDWRRANRPPFRGIGMAAQLQVLENCQMALKIAQEEFGLPLVSMSPRDLMLGRRKIILSLVYQLMRYHTMQLLESIAATTQQQQQHALSGSDDSQQPVRLSQPGSPAVTSRAQKAAAGRVNIRSSSKKQGRQLAITEQDILHWANAKLQKLQPLYDCQGQQSRNSSHSEQADQPTAVVVAPIIRSFKDPVLASGVVLLQLLHVMAPDAVDMSFVTPGLTEAQRQSNAKYALAVADKMGCSLFLVWEDLVDLQPRMVLVLLASLMYLDQTTLNAV